MKTFYWVGAFIVISGGIALSLFFGGIESRAVQKIKYSKVDTPEKFGAAVFARLREEIRQSNVLFLGVDPYQEEHYKMWQGFIHASNIPGYAYQVISIDPQLPHKSVMQFSGEIDIQKDAKRFISGVQQAIKDGQRVLFIFPSVYVSQLIKQSPASVLQSQYQIKVMTMTASNFPQSREEEKDFEPTCVVENDTKGTGTLGCEIFEMARNTYRKVHDPKKYAGLMSLVGLDDYLVLFNPPMNEP